MLGVLLFELLDNLKRFCHRVESLLTRKCELDKAENEAYFVIFLRALLVFFLEPFQFLHIYNLLIWLLVGN